VLACTPNVAGCMAPGSALAVQIALLLLARARALTSKASAKPAPEEVLIDQKIALAEIVAPYTETWTSLRGVARSIREFALRSQPQASSVALFQRLRAKDALEPVQQGGMYEEMPNITMTHLLAEGCFFVLIASLTAFLYRYFRPFLLPARDEKVKQEPRYPHEFEYRLGDSRGCDPELICCSFCCLGIRWATTVSGAGLGLMSFWPMFLLFVCIQGFSPLLFGFGYVIWLIMVIVCRQKIRETYGLDHANWWTYTEDCCSWFWCPACAGAQEARQLELVQVPPKSIESEQQAPEQQQGLPYAVSGL